MKMTTFARLWLLSGSAIIGIILVGLILILRISELSTESHNSLESMTNEKSTMAAIKNAQIRLNLQAKSFKDILLRGNSAENYNKYTKEFKDHAEKVQSYLTETASYLQKRNLPIDAVESIKHSHAEMTFQYLAALTKYDQNDPTADKVIDKLVKGIDRPTNAAMDKLATDGDKHFDELLKEQIEKANSENRTASITGFIIISIGVIIMISLSLIINRKIMIDLGGDPSYAAEIVSTIAHGNLTQKINVKAGDTTSLLARMSRMQSYLRDVINNIRQASNTLGESSRKLAEASVNVAKSSEYQRDSSSAMAASVEELTVSISHVSDNATSAHDLATHSKQSSQNAEMHVRNTVTDISKIAESFNSSTQSIHVLGEQSNQISSIINVIKEIADQTNLLALNAAIEAARAGEQGRGFAVVADEVRKLAEKTSNSTQRISDMITTIQQHTQTAIHQIEAGTSQVQAGVQAAADATTSMKEIEAISDKVLGAVDAISVALREQTIASHEIAKNVEHSAQLTDENGISIDEVSRSAQHLEILAKELQDSVKLFKTEA